MRKYDPKELEPKWQKLWAETGINKTPELPLENKYYCLVMFPYPSGDLHTGHWYNFGPADTAARFARMQGKQVLHPMGFDAFGLPAENAAIKRGIQPSAWTDQNIASMKIQLGRLGAMYDDDRTIDTSKPEYYRWTQWLFLQLYEAGLAYRAKGLQNWCPKDQTVLANEQVVGENNVCDRCGTPVIKKELEQWFFKITDYADRLLGDLDTVVWPERVKTMQENWIGRSQGATIRFQVEGHKDELEVFTTRADTLFGATYVVLAPEHPLVAQITKPDQKAKVEAYQKEAARQTELDRLEQTKEKTGVFTGAEAINPINGEKLPIWIADYVLMTYGTGAIMAVPAHDERDHEFAVKFDLPIKVVVEPVLTQTVGSAKFRENEEAQDSPGIIALVKHWEDDKYLGLEWPGAGWGTLLTGGIDDGDTAEDTVLKEIHEETGYKNAKIIRSLGVIHSKYYHEPKQLNRFGHASTFYVELENGERDEVSADEQSKHNLKWLTLDELGPFLTATSHQQAIKVFRGKIYGGDGLLIDSGEFDGLIGHEARQAIIKHLYEQKQGEGKTNYRLRDWLISRQRYWGAPIPIVYCDDCGIVPVPEDQLPVVLPLDVEFKPSGRSPLAERPDFYETTCPKCARPARRETDTMDTFVDSSWYFLRYPNTNYDKGPFDPEAVEAWAPVDLYIGGVEHAILHLLYARFITKFLNDQQLISFNEPFKKLFNQGIILGPDGQKMSKSRGNVVNPDELVEKYGADTFRMYLMFMGPYDQGGPFNANGAGGVNRFLYRVWQLTSDYLEAKPTADEAGGVNETRLATIMHKTIRKVTRELEDFGFNTAIASLMECVNELVKLKVDLPFATDKPAWSEAISTLLRLLAPFAPHLSEELWQELGETTSIHLAPWPEYREELVRDELITVAVQFNGKLRATIVLDPATASDPIKLEAAAQADASVIRQLEGKTVLKTIAVPRKIVNFVVKDK